MTTSPPEPRPTLARRRGARDGVCALGIVLLAVAVWYFRIILPAHIPFDILTNGDFFTQIYPMSLRAAAWVRQGVLPLWNPYQYCGHPLLATGIYGVLYPPNALYLIVPAHVAIEVLAVLHLAAAGLFMYAYGRTIALGRTASFVAATTFMLSGFLLSQAAWFPPALAAAVWLPLALLALERLFRDADLGSAFLLAIAVAMSFLGGWPQTWMYGMYILAVYGLGRFIAALGSPPERSHLVRASVLIVAGITLALALMAPQLLPSLELQGLGPRRTGGLSQVQALPLGVLTPDWLFTLTVNSTPGPARLAYLGISAFLLIPLSLFTTRSRWRVVSLWVLAAFSLCVALSIAVPAVFAFYNLIGGSRFRAPTRALYIYAVVGAILVGIGFDVAERFADSTAALARASTARRWRLIGLALVSVLAVTGWATLSLPALARGYLAAALVLLWGSQLAPAERARRLCVLALAGLIAGDLFVAMRNPYLHPFHDPRVFDRQLGVFGYIKAHQGLERTYIKNSFDISDWMSKQGSLREIYSVTDYEPLSLSRYERFFRAMEAPKDQRPDFLTFTGTLHADPAWEQFRLLDLMSVRYTAVHKFDMLALVAFNQLKPKWTRVMFGLPGDAVLYVNADPLPRAYVAQRAIAAASEDDALALTTGSDFDPRASVVLEHDGEEIPATSDTPSPISPARITRYDPDRVVIDLEAPAAGYLVLTDTYYPGWRATVDGAPTPILRANYLFRAVHVGAGTHTVTFTYAPSSFRLGLTLAIAGSAAAALAAMIAARRRRPAAALRAAA